MSNPKHALLLVAHGSRVEQANSEVAQLAQRMAALVDSPYAQVAHAFLEIAQPSIPEGIDSCIAQGYEKVDILPYFLAAGRHVREDIPEIVEQARQRHPQATLNVCPYLGLEPQLPQVLLDLARGNQGD